MKVRNSIIIIIAMIFSHWANAQIQYNYGYVDYTAYVKHTLINCIIPEETKQIIQTKKLKKTTITYTKDYDNPYYSCD